MQLGKALGLVHSKPCKDAYRVWFKDKSADNKVKMIQAKKDCPLCFFKNSVRTESKQNEKVGN